MHKLVAKEEEFRKAAFWAKKCIDMGDLSKKANDLRIFYEFNAILDKYPRSKIDQLPEDVREKIAVLQQNISHYRICSCMFICLLC